jgi:hypothetical protein
VAGVEEEVGGKRADTSKVIHSKGDKGNVLGIEGGDNVSTLGGVGCASLKFRADASQVSPENKRDRRVGLLGKAA